MEFAGGIRVERVSETGPGGTGLADELEGN